MQIENKNDETNKESVNRGTFNISIYSSIECRFLLSSMEPDSFFGEIYVIKFRLLS